MKNFLGIKNLTKEEVLFFIKKAKSFKNNIKSSKFNLKKELQIIATLFYEPSTRTRLSFEISAKRLGFEVINLTKSESSIEKGESLLDTIKTLKAMGVNLIVIRHFQENILEDIVKSVDISIINAGDGSNEHPSQGLSDILTILDSKSSLENLNILIIGDILHSRVARSNIYGFSLLGAKLRLIAPDELIPLYVNHFNCKVYSNLTKALENVDVIYCLRLQYERHKKNYNFSRLDYNKKFGINKDNVKMAKPDVILMHPGPVNAGIEINIDSELLKYSKINEQISNGIKVRMALLDWILG